MPHYLVESMLPGVTIADLEAVQRAMAATSEQLTLDGKHVRYVRATFLPGDSRCLCIFEATDPAFVLEVNDRANVPYTRVTNAVELSIHPSA